MSDQVTFSDIAEAKIIPTLTLTSQEKLSLCGDNFKASFIVLF